MRKQGFLTPFPAREPRWGERETAHTCRKSPAKPGFSDTSLPVLPRLNRRDHVDAALVAAALVGGGEEGVDDLQGDGLADHAGAHGDHVGVVVQAGHVGAVALAAHGGADAVDLVGGQGDADAGAADEDAEVGLAVCHELGGLVAVDGVVAALGAVGANVCDLVALGAQVLDDGELEGQADVVASDDDVHG